MQARDRCVKEEKRNNDRGRSFARQAQDGRSCPEQPRDDSDVKPGHGEQMQGTSLLKRFFDILARLMA